MDAYEMLGTIGEGTYGVVLRARHTETGQVRHAAREVWVHSVRALNVAETALGDALPTGGADTRPTPATRSAR